VSTRLHHLLIDKYIGCLYQKTREPFLTELQKQHLDVSAFSYLTDIRRLVKSLVTGQCMGQGKSSAFLIQSSTGESLLNCCLRDKTFFIVKRHSCISFFDTTFE